MITVQDAAKKALEYVRGFYPPEELPHLRVEEVELSNDGKAWRITLGWAERAVVESPARLLGLAESGVNVLPRVYKLLTVDAESGDVRSMKIRNVA